MTRIPISFDLDGVVADGHYVPVEERTNAVYFRKPPVRADVAAMLRNLAIYYDIFFISARSHINANIGARAWLKYILGLDLETVAGVITGSLTWDGVDPTSPYSKIPAIQSCGSRIHIDDDPNIIAQLPYVGLLMPSNDGWAKSAAAAGQYPTCRTWPILMHFLLTPGAELPSAQAPVLRCPLPPDVGGILAPDVLPVAGVLPS
jgi:hypothetical protein